MVHRYCNSMYPLTIKSVTKSDKMIFHQQLISPPEVSHFSFQLKLTTKEISSYIKNNLTGSIFKFIETFETTPGQINCLQTIVSKLQNHIEFTIAMYKETGKKSYEILIRAFHDSIQYSSSFFFLLLYNILKNEFY